MSFAMNEIIPILQIPSTFMLFLAPPGWGKTSLLINLHQNFELKIIYLSPLRAIAEEFYNRFPRKNDVYKPNTKKDCQGLIKKFHGKKKAFLITTCELLDDDTILNLVDNQSQTIFIFDEFHLIYYWGESFREKLWETFLGVCNTGFSVLGLSATMDHPIYEKLKKDLRLGMEHFYLLDLGNQRLKKTPAHNHFFYFKKTFVRRFLYEMNHNTHVTYLFFCKYRKSVEFWVQFFQRKKISVLGCVGGKAQEFMAELKENPNPRCIFATSVLGHGVNLPSITKIFIDYEEVNRDFYIQMVGRGGRFGEDFDLYGFNSNLFLSKKIKLISFFKAFMLDILYLRYRLNFWYRNGKQGRRIINSQSGSRRPEYCCQTTFTQWKDCLGHFLWRARWGKKNKT